MAEQRYLMKQSDSYIYPYTEALSKEPGFVLCDKEGNLVGGSMGLKMPGRTTQKPPATADAYASMKKDALVRLLKNMPIQVEEYFTDLGQPVPDLEKEHIAKLRKYAKGVLEGETSPAAEAETEA